MGLIQILRESGIVVSMQSLKKPMEADEEERRQLSEAELRYRDIAMTEYRRWGSTDKTVHFSAGAQTWPLLADNTVHQWHSKQVGCKLSRLLT